MAGYIVTAGLPRLGPRRASASSPSENTACNPAHLHLADFVCVRDIPWDPQRKGSTIWSYAADGNLRDWGSETDLQTAVKIVLGDIIYALGLAGMIKCYQELSIFKLRADIWVVVHSTGVPVGVVDVKRPGKGIMDSEQVHGQIYDYMMRLRSFHGLRHVFGIVSTYNQWRVYWFDGCNEIAQSPSYRIVDGLSSTRKEELPDPPSDEEDNQSDSDESIEEAPGPR